MRLIFAVMVLATVLAHVPAAFIDWELQMELSADWDEFNQHTVSQKH